VIVIDSSDDDTDKRIEARFPEVRLLHREGRLAAGVARNLGARSARGELLAFTDADCIVDPDWLARIRSRHDDPPLEGSPNATAANDALALAGSIRNGTPESPVGSAEYLVEFSGSLPDLPRRPVPFAVTANLSIRKEAFLASPRFDGSRTGQDMVFGEEFRSWGGRILFEPSIGVAHTNRTRFLRFLRQQFRLGAGSARVRKRFPLEGHWVVRVPPLIPLLLPYRLIQIARRSCTGGWRPTLQFVSLAPLVFVGLISWTVGFLVGAVSRKTGLQVSEPTRCSPAEPRDSTAR
jgi:glycosyltransferase involved in cell wall biosynthesis